MSSTLVSRDVSKILKQPVKTPPTDKTVDFVDNGQNVLNIITGDPNE